MMFAQREKAFEDMFAHEEAVHFRAKAYRNKAVAAWAAGVMTKPLAERSEYQESIVSFAVDHGGDEAVVQRIHQDLGRAGYPVALAEIRAKLDSFMAEADQVVRS